MIFGFAQLFKQAEFPKDRNRFYTTDDEGFRWMKTRRNIYIGLGSFLILLNIIVDVVELAEYRPTPGISPYGISYFLGAHILLIFGLLLLRMAYTVNQQVNHYLMSSGH